MNRRYLYRSMPWFIKPYIFSANKHYRQRMFNKIAKKTNGMLQTEVYEKIFHYSYNFANSNMIEIGAAHGSASISIGLGMKSRGNNTKLFSFEKGEGGSRKKYGDKKTNISIINRNIKYFNLQKYIEVITDRITEDYILSDNVKINAPFSLMLIDADGNIFRDLKIFYDLCLPGAAIIIDDYDIEKKRNELPSLNKSYKTYCYVNYLIEKGLLIKKEVMGNTFLEQNQ